MVKIIFSKKGVDDLEGIKSHITDELLDETEANKTVSNIIEKVHMRSVFLK